jgi:cytochrome c-type biogenesis protein CcmH
VTLFVFLTVAMTAAAVLLLALPMWRTARGAPDRETRKRLAALKRARDEGLLDADEYALKRDRILASAPQAGPAQGRLPIAGIAFLLLLPLGTWWVYREVGTPQALDPLVLRHGLAGPAGANPPDMDSAIRALAQRMAENPDNLDGWMLLARSYRTVERFAEARDALAQARRLAPNDIDLMVEYAEANALASPTRRIDGESLALLETAIGRAPGHQRALWLLGISRLQQGDNAGAVAYWEQLLRLLPDDSDVAMQIREQIAEARGAAPALAPVPPLATTAPGNDAPRLTLEVSLDPALAAGIGASEALFVFARPAGGARAPLAIRRMAAGALPATVTLGIEDAMVEGMNIATFPEVEVGARISRTGNAVPQRGDLEGIVGPLPSDTREPIRLVIDRVVQ